jgi:hypothetical protein
MPHCPNSSSGSMLEQHLATLSHRGEKEHQDTPPLEKGREQPMINETTAHEPQQAPLPSWEREDANNVSVG